MIGNLENINTKNKEHFLEFELPEAIKYTWNEQTIELNKQLQSVLEEFKNDANTYDSLINSHLLKPNKYRDIELEENSSSKIGNDGEECILPILKNNFKTTKYWPLGRTEFPDAMIDNIPIEVKFIKIRDNNTISKGNCSIKSPEIIRNWFKTNSIYTQTIFINVLYKVENGKNIVVDIITLPISLVCQYNNSTTDFATNSSGKVRHTINTEMIKDSSLFFEVIDEYWTK